MASERTPNPAAPSHSDLAKSDGAKSDQAQADRAKTYQAEADAMTDFDPNLDDLFEGSADKDRRAARDAMAQSADGRRLLAVHDALNDPPSQVDVPNLVPAVMARIAAAAQRSAADQRTAAASPPDTWGMRLAAWLARFNIAPGPVMAVGALAAVVVLAVAIDQGPMRTGGLSGAAVWSAAHVWTAVVAVMFAALAVAWWLRRR